MARPTGGDRLARPAPCGYVLIVLPRHAGHARSLAGTAAAFTIGTAPMLTLLLPLALGVGLLLYFLHRTTTNRLVPTSPEELALIDRAANGDESAAKELLRLGQQEEDGLRTRAATDPRAARQLLDRKQTHLKGLRWAEESLEAKAAAAGYSAEKTAEVRARIVRLIQETTRDIEWAKIRL